MDKAEILHQIMDHHKVFYLEIENARLAPMAIIFTRDGNSVQVIIDDLPNWDVVELGIRKAIRAYDGIALAFITESWLLMGKPEELDLTIRPSDSPDRIEAVTTVVVDKEGSLTGLQRIDRDATGTVTALVTIEEGDGDSIGPDFFDNLFSDSKTLH